MKSCFRFQSRAVTLGLALAIGVSSPFLARPSVGAPKKELEVWPGRRVLLVLPLTLSSTWNADAELGRAILPLSQPQLQQALTNTNKFSITLPYRFDPVLRRGLTEKRIAENEINALLAAPTLETARPVVNKLVFEQPVMIADVNLEELTVGGTAKTPTVQIRASGRLYEQGSDKEIKNISIRSRPVTGRTPAERISAAANQVFTEIAAEFVAAPPAFELQLPPAPEPTPERPKNGTASASTPTGTIMQNAPAMPGAIASPNSMTTVPGVPLVPQLPAPQPPLGIAAGAEGTIGR
ncbi:MAG TPA: hypothetical protein VGB45_06775 [Abditibacterium sp.]|jgi:hypothetical protein